MEDLGLDLFARGSSFVSLIVGPDRPRVSHCRLSREFGQFSLRRLPQRPPNDTLHLDERLYLLPPCYGIVEKAAKLAWILISCHSHLFQSLVQRRSRDLG